MSGVFFERVAASAVAAVLAFTGVHSGAPQVPADPPRSGHPSATPEARFSSVGPRPSTLEAATNNEGAPAEATTQKSEPAPARVITALLDADFSLSRQPDGEGPDESDDNGGGITTGPTTTSKPVTDKVREVVETVEEIAGENQPN
jgi:hypothetical protein